MLTPRPQTSSEILSNPDIFAKLDPNHQDNIRSIKKRQVSASAEMSPSTTVRTDSPEDVFSEPKTMANWRLFRLTEIAVLIDLYKEWQSALKTAYRAKRLTKAEYLAYLRPLNTDITSMQFKEADSLENEPAIAEDMWDCMDGWSASQRRDPDRINVPIGSLGQRTRIEAEGKIRQDLSRHVDLEEKGHQRQSRQRKRQIFPRDRYGVLQSFR